MERVLLGLFRLKPFAAAERPFLQNTDLMENSAIDQQYSVRSSMINKTLFQAAIKQIFVSQQKKPIPAPHVVKRHIQKSAKD